MALSEFEIKRYEKIVSEFVEKHRPPADIRNKVDLAFRIEGQNVEIFEIRPAWKNTEVSLEESIARATYVKTGKFWKIYWKRADQKWYRYEPAPQVKTIEEFLSMIEQDEYGCFFG